MPAKNEMYGLNKNLSNMNEAQRQAVLHGEGPLLLLAGPGSGKTFTITNRILHLLEQGISPETILVITFTKDAALSMQNRFQKLSSLECPKFLPVNFGTFHSVFYQILKESHVFNSNHLLNVSEKKNLLIPILKKYDRDQQRFREESRSALKEEAGQILSAISYYKNTMCLSRAEAKTPARWQSCFEEIYREYEKTVKNMGRIDFDDMLYLCRKLLQENKAAKEYWRKRFLHILIDEFQDINPVQYEVVKLLSPPPYNLFAVGDDDQAIYGFRGADPNCLKRFSSEYRARELLLDINYRSVSEIVKASLAVIGENQNIYVKKLRSFEVIEDLNVYNVSGGKKETEERLSGGIGVTLHAFMEKEEEYQYLLRRFPEISQTGESHAVLFRTNSQMQRFAARLQAAEIPYEMREKGANIYDHFIVTDIMSYLLLANGQGSREHMLRIMNKPCRYINREAVLEGWPDIQNIHQYYEQVMMPLEEKNKVRNHLRRFEKQLQSIGRLSLSLSVSYILKAVGYENYLKEISVLKPEKWLEWQEVLEWIKEDAVHFPDVRAWKAFQEEYARSPEQSKTGRVWDNRGRFGQGRDSQGFGRESQPVRLMTVHGAKGLEFDRVWIPDCNERVFPYGRMPDESTVEEERRLFYVAMTRAKKNLELLYLIGTEERPRHPSRFLNSLRKD